MAKDLNHVVMIGRLVRDPETKYTPSGVAVTKFSIANNDMFTRNNERVEHVNFFDVNVWGAHAVNCEKYLKKGSQVAIDGYLRQNRWEDQNGQTRSKVEITANNVQFLTPAGQGGGNAMPMQNMQQQQPPVQQQPVYQQQQQPQQQQQQNSGFIEDPWGDSSNKKNVDPYMQQVDSDDDIPF